MVFKINLIKIPERIPAEGFNIPVLAGFKVFNKIPFIAFAKNNFNPKLILYDDYLEVRVFWKKIKIFYFDINFINVLFTFGTRNLIICSKGKVMCYSCNLWKIENLKEVLSFFDKKKVRLSSKANNILKN